LVVLIPCLISPSEISGSFSALVSMENWKEEKKTRWHDDTCLKAQASETN
jgi:hypothetical protein